MQLKNWEMFLSQKPHEGKWCRPRSLFYTDPHICPKHKLNATHWWQNQKGPLMMHFKKYNPFRSQNRTLWGTLKEITDRRQGDNVRCVYCRLPRLVRLLCGQLHKPFSCDGNETPQCSASRMEAREVRWQLTSRPRGSVFLPVQGSSLGLSVNSSGQEGQEHRTKYNRLEFPLILTWQTIPPKLRVKIDAMKMATRFMSLAIFLIWTRMNSLPGSAHWPFKGFKCVNSNDQFLLGA